jgi:hypothetical protein
MAWGDYRSESFADTLDNAGNILKLVASIVGAVGFFSGVTPLLVGAAVIGFAGMVVPPVYGLVESIARKVAVSRLEKTLAADPEELRATIEKLRPRLEAGCESERYQEMVALRHEVASRYRTL